MLPTLPSITNRAEALYAAIRERDADAEWKFKWLHPRFAGMGIAEVRATPLTLEDARLVIAREEAFDHWADLRQFVDDAARPGPVRRFEDAVDAVTSGAAAALIAMLADTPGLATARSARRHRATLLHYLGANGVEGYRQRTPPNAIEIGTILLDAGAEVDALATLYDEQCTTMSMLVSSSPPAEAGLQGALVDLLLDRGAAFDGQGTRWHSALMTALSFGFLDTARRLATRGAPLDTLPAVAGLGLVEQVRQLLPAADARARQFALALAAQLGHADVVQLFIDAGDDIDRFNPEGLHAHSTPLHQAVAAGHLDVVRRLVAHGAQLDRRDTLYLGTPLDWAEHCRQDEVAAFLREAGASRA